MMKAMNCFVDLSCPDASLTTLPLDAIVVIAVCNVGILHMHFLLWVSARHRADIPVTGRSAADLRAHINFWSGHYDSSLDFVHR